MAFTYEQDESTGISVRVAVPPATSKADVAVLVLADRLSVSVKGHALQPHVLDGTLFYDADPDSTAWALEGSGDARALVIEFAKAEPVDWDEGLFRVATADTEPPPTIPRDRSWTPADVPVSEARDAVGAAPPRASTAEALSLDEKHKKALDKLTRLKELRTASVRRQRRKYGRI